MLVHMLRDIPIIREETRLYQRHDLLIRLTEAALEQMPQQAQLLLLLLELSFTLLLLEIKSMPGDY